MQSTLLGLAIAIILALLTALVGPYFVDWNRYRSDFEKEASRLVGLPVKVGGAIDVRLLPTPSITLRQVEVSRRSGGSVLQANALGLELNLGQLVRGRLRANEMHLLGPEFRLGLDRDGRFDWRLPVAIAGENDAFAIDKFNIEDGRAVIADAASGNRVVLDKFWFNGEVRSLAGVLKGEGAFVIGEALYGYRVVSSKLDDGGLKLKLGIDSADRPLSFDGDGTLDVENGVPRFDGAVSLARPVGMTTVDGRNMVTDPWRVTAKVKAGPASALFEQVEFQYGPEERALKLTGTSEFRFGPKPKLTGVLSARQLDLDRAFATPDATKRLPVAALRGVIDLFTAAGKPPIPLSVGVAADSITIGGATVQSLRGDIAFDGSNWTLDRVEARAPGITQIRLGGKLTGGGRTLGFAGPVEVDAGDPRAFLAWLEGRSEQNPNGLRTLSARGEVTLGPDGFAIERLKAELDREALTGRLAYRRPAGDKPAQLEAELHAAQLDVDSLIAFGNAALAGTSLERPRDVKLALDIGQALIAGITATRVDARLRFDAGGLQVEHLAVADLGGAAFDASGRIDTGASAPRGSMTVDLNARELGGVVALLEKFAPAAVAPLRRVAGRLAPARLHATIAIDRSTGGADAATSAKLSAMGTLGATKVSLIGEASGDPAAPRSARVELDGKLDADDGAALLRLLDLDRFLAVTTGAGQLSFSANGPLDGKLRVISRLTAGGLDVAAAGTAAWPKDAAVDAEFRLAVTRADASPLRPTGTVGTAGGLPVSLSTRVAIAGSKIALDALSGQVAGGDIRGNLKIAVDTPITIDGNIETDYLDARAVLAAAIGMPLDGAGAGAWSSDPFTAGALANVGGRIELRGARVAVSQHLDLDDLHAVVRLAPARFGLEDFAARLGGGRLAGALDIGRGVAGVTARMRLDVKDVATAAALLPATVSGRIAAHLEVEGSGLSPKALAGSVAGTGTLTLSDGRLAGIDARAFDTVTQAIDHGVPIEAGKIRNLVDASFAAGRVEVPVLTAPVTVASGQLRVARAQAQIGPAELSVGGSLDLVKGDVDARLVVSGPRGDFATLAGRPDVTVNLRGPYGEPKRSLDVSALVGWLTLRSVEQQARRLEAIESERRAPAIDKPVRGPAPSFRPPQNGAESESPVSARAVPLGRAGLDLLRPEPRNVVPSDSAPDQQTARTPSRTDRAPSLPPPLDIGPPPGAEHRQSAPLAPAARERTLFDSLIRP